MDSEFHIGEYIAILKRRFLFFLVPFVLITSIGAVVVVMMPPIYLSKGTILVESQQISTDLIRSTITTYAEERIQVIRQRVMTRENLLNLANKFNIVPQTDEKLTQTEIIDQVRQNIGIIVVSNAQQRFRFGQQQSSLAFSISFQHRNPGVALAVTNELVTLFLDENISTRIERASQTTDFLTDQAQELKTELEAIESRIAEYKQQNSDALPEHLNLRLDMLERARKTLTETELEIKSITEERRFLDIERASLMAAQAQGVQVAGVQVPQKSELEILNEQLIEKLSIFGEEHPDVKALMRKIKAHENKPGAEQAKRTILENQLERQLQELSVASSKYTEEHPEYKKIATSVERLERELAELPKASPEEKDEPEIRVENIGVQKVELALQSIEEKRVFLLGEKDKLISEIEKLEAQVLKIPQVERGLTALSRDYDNSLRKYEELRAKQMEAQFSENLEAEQKAERFTLLEPPVRADTPFKPNRKKMGAMLFVVAFGLGCGGIFLIEMFDQSIRGTKSLEAIVDYDDIINIPYIKTEKEIKNKRRNIYIFFGTVFVLGVSAIVAVHFMYKPLDILFYKILNRLQ